MYVIDSLLTIPSDEENDEMRQASFNYIIFILLMVVIGCQCLQKLKCKLRRERSHSRGHVIIPMDEEDDEMRQAPLLLTD